MSTLATALLLDCFDNDCDEVVVISNDSDLIAPVTAVRQRFGKPVGVISPQPAQTAQPGPGASGVVVIRHHQPAALCQQPTAAAANRRQRDFYQTGNVVRIRPKAITPTQCY